LLGEFPTTSSTEAKPKELALAPTQETKDVIEERDDVFFHLIPFIVLNHTSSGYSARLTTV
jgi:hypothetical protein